MHIRSWAYPNIRDQFSIATRGACDNSRNANQYIPDGTADLVLTYPPYHNLEKYSDSSDDLSNMSYEDFVDAYREIISISCRKLKDNRFAVFVVGDIRDKKGAYRDFVGLTTDIFMENGLCLYNSSILLEMFGTGSDHCGQNFHKREKGCEGPPKCPRVLQGEPQKHQENIQK